MVVRAHPEAIPCIHISKCCYRQEWKKKVAQLQGAVYLPRCIPDVFFCFALLSKSLCSTELVWCWFCVLEAAQCSTSLQLCLHCTAVLEPRGSISAHIQQHCAPARGTGFPADNEPAHVRAVMWAPSLARDSLSPHGSSPSFFLLSHRGVCSIED